MKRIGLIAAVVSAIVLPAGASHQAGHTQPQGPAKVRFAPGFPALVDHEWGFRLGGFGGVRPGARLRHVPVIFVHGNTVDHADWYPVRDAFRAAGWSDQELWALSYNGLGGNQNALFHENPERDSEHDEMGWDGTLRITNNDLNVPDLYDFIRAVRTYTGSARFSIVSHSLGVTVARKTLKVHPELRRDLVAFVGIAGGNHGTSLCPPGTEGVAVSCDEIAAGTAWLQELNGTDGADETYAPAKWMTVFDGSGAVDFAYASPVYAKSPQLKGAINLEFPLTYHNDLRIDPAIIAVYRAFVSAAEKPYLLSATKRSSPKVLAGRRASPPRATLAGTGVGVSWALAAALLMAAAFAASLVFVSRMAARRA